MSAKVFLVFIFLLALLVGAGQFARFAAQPGHDRFFCIHPDDYAADLWRMSLRFLREGDPRDLHAMADFAAQRHGIDPPLFRSLVAHESAWQTDAVSVKGAMGLTQLMPATAAEECGLRAEDLTQPASNLDCGARYLAKQLRRFGDVELALCAYNAGPEITARLGRCPTYRETQRYVSRIMSAWENQRHLHRKPL